MLACIVLLVGVDAPVSITVALLIVAAGALQKVPIAGVGGAVPFDWSTQLSKFDVLWPSV